MQKSTKPSIAFNAAFNAAFNTPFKRTVILVLIVFLFPCSSRSETSKFSFLQAGLLTSTLSRESSNARGESTLVSSVSPSIGALFKIGNSPWKFMPSVHYTVFGRESYDRAASVHQLIFSFPAAYEHLEWDFKFGPGLKFQFISGNGGLVRQNNGVSSLDFYRPNRSSTAILFYWDLGVGYQINDELRADFDFIVTGALSSRRAFQGLFQIGYGIF